MSNIFNFLDKMEKQIKIMNFEVTHMLKSDACTEILKDTPHTIDVVE
jgi:hypothetical protein